MKFCSLCGSPTQERVPEGDTRLRAVCSRCDVIHYVNPKMVLGTIPVWGEQVLLCRRAIEPRLGMWTLPAGFMEVGESTANGAMRETMEEAGARVELGPLFSVLDVPHVDQVHLFYLATLLDLDFAAGPESLEVRLFHEHEIPWASIAFRTIIATLRFYFHDRRHGTIGLHTGDIREVQLPHESNTQLDRPR
ncbi:MAG: zinc ribbon domain-containing protein [Betaproteobacteria bacterium]|nr:zinc ribbon domain-containing protein [Betaproteobacteria bacterium]